MDLTANLGNRTEDILHNLHQESEIFSPQQIKGFKTFIKSTLAYTNEGNVKPPPQQFLPTNSQSKVLRYIEAHLSSKTKLPIRILVLGEAGTGKTFLQLCISRVLRAHKKVIIKGAPTGFSAYNSNSFTLHHIFGLTHHSRDFKELIDRPIPAHVVEKLKFIEYFLCDEFYLLGLNFLQFVNKTLQRIKNKHTLFGGVSFLGFGDPQQLSCVGDKSFFSNLDSLDIFARQGLNAYHSLECFKLKENKRIKSDARFHQLLRHLRYKRINSQDIDLLRTRLYSKLSDQEKNKFAEAICIYPTNIQAEQQNKIKLVELGKPVLRLRTKQTPHKPRVVDDFDLFISENARVFLTRNLLTVFGLVNGRVGTVTKIVFEPETSSPSIIFVKFDDWVHPTAWNDSIPITKIKDSVFDKKTRRTFKTERFPLRCCWGLTLHRVQGSQFRICKLLYGLREVHNNYSYTLTSRVSSLTDIAILDRYIDSNRFSRTNPSFMRDFDQQRNELIRIRAAREADFEDSDQDSPTLVSEGRAIEARRDPNLLEGVDLVWSD